MICMMPGFARFLAFAWPAYNTQQVLWGTGWMGLAAGVLGVFVLLRKRALVADVVSHSALPGVVIAFLVGEHLWPNQPKSLLVLLTGAALAGLVGMGCLSFLTTKTRIKEDAALGIVLSVFFGLGVSLLSVVQRLPTGQKAGLEDFILGKTASITAADVRLLATVAIAVVVTCGLLFKEFAFLAFDAETAASKGLPIRLLDGLMLTLVVAVTVTGLQSVGVLLVVALLILPPAAARFWTNRLGTITLLSGLGGCSMTTLGVLWSASQADIPAGPAIVLVGTVWFAIGFLLGTERGLIPAWVQQRSLRRRIDRADLLRACYEILESRGPQTPLAERFELPISPRELESVRPWGAGRLSVGLRAAFREGLLRHDSQGALRLTANGLREARGSVRNHRLWELYLLGHTDVSPARVDRSADLMEHALEPAILEELQELLAREHPDLAVPDSPHPL